MWVCVGVGVVTIGEGYRRVHYIYLPPYLYFLSFS